MRSRWAAWVFLCSLASWAVACSCGDDTPGGGGAGGGGSDTGGAPAGGSGGNPSTGGTAGAGGTDLCGNGALDPNETCDGASLNGETCATQGHVGGTLGCSADCQSFDTSACTDDPCGNGQLDAGETCDGADLNGETCITQGFSSGMLGCQADCMDFDVSGCNGSTPLITQCATLTPLPNGQVCQVTPGNGARLIRGTILTPGEILEGGEVLVDASGNISCVACDCSAQANGASEIECPQGVVSPGLINTHDHITFTQNDPYTNTGERYEHRHDWRRGLHNHTQINASGGATADQVRWGELRFVMGGATSTVGSGGQVGFLRNLDSANQEGLNQGVVNFETFPLDDSAGTQRDGDCNYGAAPDTSATIANDPAYLPHISEGIDAFARNEFLCTSNTTFDTTAPGLATILAAPQSAFIHSVGLRAPDYALLASTSTSVIWSPRSNVTLYGDTAVVTEAANLGVLIALGTDWVVSGSMNMLRELQCASDLNRDRFGSFFSDEDLWLMATYNAAVATSTDDAIGVLAPGRVGDISIFDGAVHPYHRAVIDAEAQDVTLVMRGGKVLYGDAALISALSSTSCDSVDVCGTSKSLCTQSEIGKTLAQLQGTVGTIYPAFFCGTPTNEPSCVPSRPASVNGSTTYDGQLTATDSDGDGIANAADNCPTVFNPIRPVDNGAQADFDQDGVGDACDVCPLDANSTTCTPFDPNDQDSDGVANLDDNCPANPNTNQLDSDNDDKGDVCDVCPMDYNPGSQGCPATIYEIKNGTIPPGAPVHISDALVTGKATNGFFAQVKEGDAGYLGANYSGIFVFTGTGSPNNAALIGNRVAIDGAVQDFFGELEISGVSAVTITSATVEPPPAPISVPISAVTTGGPQAAQLEGVIVTVSDLTVTQPMNAFNEYTVIDGTGALLVDDLMYLTSPAPAANDFYTSISGIVAFRNSASKLHPRVASDVVKGLAIATFSPTLSYLDLGDSGVPTYPTALTVTLNGTAAMDTFVPIVSSDPTTVTVQNGGVTVLAGQTNATVFLSGLTVGSSTLTATLGASLNATVQVVDPAQPPQFVSFTPASSSVPAGSTIQYTVTLDVPAIVDEDITLTLTPAGAGTIPPFVTVLAGQTSAQFNYVDNGSVVGALIQIDALQVSTGIELSATVTTVNASATHLVLNEVDYDQIGPDNTEFIEIYNGTGFPVSLSNLSLVFMNGSTSTEYNAFGHAARIQLNEAVDGNGTPATTLAAGQYLVIASTGVTTIPAGALRIVGGTSNNIQNGAPDALAILDNSTNTFVDALSYEGSITAGNVTGVGTLDFTEGGAGLTVAQCGGEASDATSTGSLVRSPNGHDTNVSSADWVFTATPSPGAANP
ncbi:MAG: thrombospondin type 3 repeat-containing protein [Polyangiaceae bacterium]